MSSGSRDVQEELKDHTYAYTSCVHFMDIDIDPMYEEVVEYSEPEVHFKLKPVKSKKRLKASTSKSVCLTSTKPSSFRKLSLEMQRLACKKIMEDRCHPENHRLSIELLQDNLQLHETLTFLDSCLVRKRKSLQTAVYKSWRNFNHLYTINSVHVHPFFLLPGLAFIFCLNLFEILIDYNFYKSQQ
uniref:Uncharacterized protein n=1 Tax=Biomphalaria glabrata TaxID=6526 RepID=A0A2C9K5W5_BIOGL